MSVINFCISLKPSKRLIYKELLLEDAKSLLKIYSNTDAMRYRSGKAHHSLSDSISFIKRSWLDTKNKEAFRLGVKTKNTDILIGTILFKPDQHLHCEIGYSIGKEYWGLGFGKEIVNTMIDSLRQQNFTKVSAWTHKDNLKSINLLKKFNFIKHVQPRYPNAYLYVLKLL